MTITPEELASIRSAAIGDMLGDPGELDKMGPAATVFRLWRELERQNEKTERKKLSVRIYKALKGEK